MGSTGPTPEEFRTLQNEVRTQSALLSAVRARVKSLETVETEALAALAARVAELEKPWYRKLGATKASVQPEARESTLLQRMEALNS